MAFGIRMGMGCLFNMPQESGCGIRISARFASFQGQTAHHMVVKSNHPDALLVCHPDISGGAEVGAGTAADALSLIDG